MTQWLVCQWSSVPAKSTCCLFSEKPVRLSSLSFNDTRMPQKGLPHNPGQASWRGTQFVKGSKAGCSNLAVTACHEISSIFELLGLEEVNFCARRHFVAKWLRLPILSCGWYFTLCCCLLCTWRKWNRHRVKPRICVCHGRKVMICHGQFRDPVSVGSTA